MPERDKAVVRASADIIGAKVFDGLSQRPRGVRKDVWDCLNALVDMAYVKAVQGIDWKRILLTASVRHRELEDRDSGHASDLMGGLLNSDSDAVCPNCIVWALLSETTSGGSSDWSATRTDRLVDVKVPADWWYDWLYGEDGKGPGPAEAIRILSPLMIEAAGQVEVEPPEDE